MNSLTQKIKKAVQIRNIDRNEQQTSLNASTRNLLSEAHSIQRKVQTKQNMNMKLKAIKQFVIVATIFIPLILCFSYLFQLYTDNFIFLNSQRFETVTSMSIIDLKYRKGVHTVLNHLNTMIFIFQPNVTEYIGGLGEPDVLRATDVYKKMNDALDLNDTLTAYFSRSWQRISVYLSDVQATFELTRWANVLFDTEVNYLGSITMNITDIDVSTLQLKEPVSLVGFSAFLTSVIVTINDTSSSIRSLNKLLNLPTRTQQQETESKNLMADMIK